MTTSNEPPTDTTQASLQYLQAQWARLRPCLAGTVAQVRRGAALLLVRALGLALGYGLLLHRHLATRLGLPSVEPSLRGKTERHATIPVPFESLSIREEVGLLDSVRPLSAKEATSKARQQQIVEAGRWGFLEAMVLEELRLRMREAAKAASLHGLPEASTPP